jgi:hypothetical protein
MAGSGARLRSRVDASGHQLVPEPDVVFDEGQRRIPGERDLFDPIAARDVEVVERLVDERRAFAAEKEPAYFA